MTTQYNNDIQKTNKNFDRLLTNWKLVGDNRHWSIRARAEKWCHHHEWWCGGGGYPKLIPGNVIEYRKKTRENFRKDIAYVGFSLTEICALLHDNVKGYDNIQLIRDSVILDNIPRAAAKRKEKLHEQRLDVSRVMMRIDLPSDLVPLVCAYAVPGSKIWEYMKN